MKRKCDKSSNDWFSMVTCSVSLEIKTNFLFLWIICNNHEKERVNCKLIYLLFLTYFLVAIVVERHKEKKITKLIKNQNQMKRKRKEREKRKIN